MSPPRDDYRDVVRAFGEVAEALVEQRELDDLLHLVVVKLCELVGVPRGSVYLREGQSGIFRGRVGHDAVRVTDDRVRRLKIGVAADAFTQEIVATKAPVVVNNAASDNRLFQTTVRAWKVRSIMGVPMVLRGDVIGIITVDPEDRPHEFTPSDQAMAAAFADLSAVAVAQQQASAELRSTIATVDQQNRVLRKVSAVDERLTALVLDGGNIREIAKAVSSLTGKPCGIYDVHHRSLASEGAPGRNDDVRPRLFDPTVRNHPRIAEALAALDDSRNAVVGPDPEAGIHHRYLAAPVMSHGQRWGTLVLMEHGSRFGQFDSSITRRAATVVALEVMAERRAAAAESDARGTLVGELVQGQRDIEKLRRRAEFLGLSLHADHALGLIRWRDSSTHRFPDVRDVLEAAERAVPDVQVFAATVSEGVALVIELGPGGGVARAKQVVQGICREMRTDEDLMAGVSRVCTDVGDYVGAYGEVTELLACLEAFSPRRSQPVLSVDELGAGRLFLVGSGRETADRFTRETLGPLNDADLRTSEVLDTLVTFFDEERSIRKTAQRLVVHENTVRYRLSRIEELTGLAVRTDSNAQLSVQLALLVLRLRQGLGTEWESAPEPRAPTG